MISDDCAAIPGRLEMPDSISEGMVRKSVTDETARTVSEAATLGMTGTDVISALMTEASVG